MLSFPHASRTADAARHHHASDRDDAWCHRRAWGTADAPTYCRASRTVDAARRHHAWRAADATTYCHVSHMAYAARRHHAWRTARAESDRRAFHMAYAARHLRETSWDGAEHHPPFGARGPNRREVDRIHHDVHRPDGRRLPCFRSFRDSHRGAKHCCKTTVLTKKGPPSIGWPFLERSPAVSYSPTGSPLQYHRR